VAARVRGKSHRRWGGVVPGWTRRQRRLESLVALLQDDPEEKGLSIVRKAYDDVCHAMAAGFTKALASSGWTVPGVLHQTRLHADIVSALPRPVAYFLVDALRFEMGADLAQRLPAGRRYRAARRRRVADDHPRGHGRFTARRVRQLLCVGSGRTARRGG